MIFMIGRQRLLGLGPPIFWNYEALWIGHFSRKIVTLPAQGAAVFRQQATPSHSRRWLVGAGKI
jgi:hypothetical protein